jgi:hypothetical protein
MCEAWVIVRYRLVAVPGRAPAAEFVTASEVRRFAFIASGMKAPTRSAMPKMNIPLGITEDAEGTETAPYPTIPSQKIIKNATSGWINIVT